MKRTKGVRDKLPVVIPYTIYRKLLKQPHNMDLIALYSYYLHESNWQGTNQPWVTNKHCLEVSSFGLNRFYAAKKALVKLRLIEPIQGQKTNKNEFGKCYIKIIDKSRYMENNRAGEERAFVSNPSQDGMAPTNQKQALYGFSIDRETNSQNAYKEKKNALNMTTPGGSSCKDEEIGSTNSKIDDPKLTESKTCPNGFEWGDAYLPPHKEICRECPLVEECSNA